VRQQDQLAPLGQMARMEGQAHLAHLAHRHSLAIAGKVVIEAEVSLSMFFCTVGPWQHANGAISFEHDAYVFIWGDAKKLSLFVASLIRPLWWCSICI